MADYYPTATDGPDFVPTELPFTPDDQFLINAMRRRGMIVEPVIWGADPADLAHYDLLLFRAPWDYMDTEAQRTAFMGWLTQLEEAGIRTENPLPLMQWLLNKRYLLDLEAQGIAIVPTHYLEPGQHADLAQAFDAQGPLILKPALSAAGAGLTFLRSREEAAAYQATLDELGTKEPYLLQPFQPEIRTEGEWSLVFLDSVYSHAVLKKPAENGILVHAERGGSTAFLEPPEAVVEAAAHAAEAVGRAYGEATHHSPVIPLYLRIDILPTARGLLVSEMEGMDPELFFRARPGSEELLCDGLASRLSQRAASVRV